MVHVYKSADFVFFNPDQPPLSDISRARNVNKTVSNAVRHLLANLLTTLTSISYPYRERRLHQKITQPVSNVRRSGEYRRIAPSVRDFQKHFPVKQKRTF